MGLYHSIECNILMLEYRGYGLSQGSPSEEGLYMDAQAGMDYLSSRTDINANEIIVFGRSLGKQKTNFLGIITVEFGITYTSNII